MKKTRIAMALLAVQVMRTAAADDGTDAGRVVKNSVDAVLSCLGNNALSDAEKRERIIATIEPVIDFPLMAKLALGKDYWPRLNAEQKKEYTGLFTEQLENSYLEKITLFSDEKVEYDPPVEVKGKIRVNTTLISKAERSAVLYKLYKAGNAWKVYDIEIQGVSIIASYRAQYGQVLAAGSPDELLRLMKEKRKPDAEAGR